MAMLNNQMVLSSDILGHLVVALESPSVVAA